MILSEPSPIFAIKRYMPVISEHILAATAILPAILTFLYTATDAAANKRIVTGNIILYIFPSPA